MALAVSFVVIAYNERTTIGDCVAAIVAQEGLESFEIVVVDDGSTDGTSDVVRQVARQVARPGLPLRLVRHDHNRGRGAARATGVETASGELVAMVDGDVVLPPDWWRACRRALESCDVAAGTAVPDGDVVYLARRYALRPRVVPHAALVTGSNALFRREVFEEVGYDPRLREGEDVALSHEMDVVGLRATTVPGLVVHHREQRGFVASLRWLFESGLGASRQLERYGQLRAPDVAFLALLASAAGALARRRRPVGRRLGVVVATLLSIAAVHVRSKFELQRRDLATAMLAVLTDAVLLASYFAGRAVGHLSRRVGGIGAPE